MDKGRFKQVFSFYQGRACRGKRLLSFLFLYVSAGAFAQARYPMEYFRPPLDDIHTISGTFGELRPNHFHSGLDIRTPAGEGQPVYAIADGYVSRIKISANGYGNALYITHPNGWVSQYGHLKEFSKGINALARSRQHKEKNWEIDVAFLPKEFRVKKGQLIAYSGNSGGSEAPHLHFELRDEKTENIINPLLFGFDVPDHTYPVISALMIAPFKHYGRVKGSSNAEIINLKWKQKGKELTEWRIDKPIYVSGDVVVGLETFDRQDASPGKNGPYEMVLSVGSDTVFFYRAETFHFKDTRYANAFLDYAEWKNSGRRFFKCFKQAGNHFPDLRKLRNNGIIRIPAKQSKACTLLVSDYAGNIRKVYFQLSGEEAADEIKAKSECALKVYPSIATNLNQKEFKAEFSQGSVYDTLCLEYDFSRSWRKNSAIHYFHNNSVPLHHPVEVAILANKLTKEERAQTYLVVEDGNNETAVAGSWNADWFRAKVKQFGKLYLQSDSKVPSVLPLNISENKTMTAGSEVLFIAVDKQSGIQNIEAFIDGKWEVISFDPKTGQVSLIIPENIKAGKHVLELKIDDLVKNRTSLTYNINIP